MHDFFSATPPATLILLGAPAPSDALYDHLRQRPPDQLYVVEPDPQRVQSLTTSLSDLPGLRILQQALGGATGAGTLHTYNFPGLRSLRAPTSALHSLFPGLRHRSQSEVEVTTPAVFLAQQSPLPRPLHLRIDLPGSELDVLDNWVAESDVPLPDRIYLRCAASDVFEGGSALAPLLTWADVHGFREIAREDEDPDWLWVTFAPDPKAQALNEAQTARAAAEAALGTRDDQIRELEAALQEALSDAQGQAQRVADLEGALSEARTRADQVRSLEAALSAAQAAAVPPETVSDLEQQVSEKTARIRHLETELTQTRDQVNTLRGETAQARGDLSVALRLQDVLTADLEDLRRRYQAVQTTCAEQRSLLQQLTPRLQQAATELRQLTQASSVPLPEAADSPAKPARKKTARKSGGSK